MKNFILWIVISAAILAFTLITTIFLTESFGQICWLPRIGALLLVLSIVRFRLFDPGDISAGHEPNISDKLRLKLGLILAFLGIMLWAFGDLVDEIGGVHVCG